MPDPSEYLRMTDSVSRIHFQDDGVSPPSLWPLGGVAFVQPPPRPGATLWSIAAGPLVNVLLIPVIYALNVAAGTDLLHLLSTHPPRGNLPAYLFEVFWINTGLLIFNMLP